MGCKPVCPPSGPPHAAPSAEEPGLPLPSPLEPALAGAAAAMPALPMGYSLYGIEPPGKGGEEQPPQHLKCLKRVYSVLTVSEIKKKQ